MEMLSTFADRADLLVPGRNSMVVNLIFIHNNNEAGHSNIRQLWKRIE